MTSKDQQQNDQYTCFRITQTELEKIMQFNNKNAIPLRGMLRLKPEHPVITGEVRGYEALKMLRHFNASVVSGNCSTTIFMKQ
jgi:hypothetical protein